MTLSARTPPDKFAAREDTNLRVYQRPEVAAHYASLDYLSPCEQELFTAFVNPGDVILDLGVGGGRTTPYLSSLASRYVGVDYSPAMVAACQQKFPHLPFHLADASNLGLFRDGMFDCVVMAFNGMDYFPSDETRLQCLAEIQRVLKKRGVAIFSRHNPTAILVRPSWGKKRIEDTALRLAGQRKWLFKFWKFFLTPLRIAAAVLQSLADSLVRLARRIPRRSFWSGHGYMLDLAHGGLLTHYSVPARVSAEMRQQGFQLLRFAGSDYPRRSSVYVTDWYYYVFQKTGVPSGSLCG